MSMILKIGPEAVLCRKAGPGGGELHIGEFLTETDYGYTRISHPNQTPVGIVTADPDQSGMIEALLFSGEIACQNYPGFTLLCKEDLGRKIMGGNLETSCIPTMQTSRTTTYPAGASVGRYIENGAVFGEPSIRIDPQPATGHCVLIKEDPDGVPDGEPVVLGIKEKRLVAIPAASVDNDNPATPAGVVIGHDGGNVYVCIDGQCRMKATRIFEFLSESAEEATVGSRISRCGAVIPNNHEVKNYSDYYTLGTLLSPYMRDEPYMVEEQRVGTVLVDVNCGPISLAKLAISDLVLPSDKCNNTLLL